MLTINALEGKKEVKFQIRISNPADIKIKSLCENKGITRSHFLRQLIQNYFEPSTKSEL